MDRQRVWADPPIQARVVIPRTEVVQPYFDIFLLAGELVILAIRVPALGAVVALDRAERLVRGSLDDLARRAVDDDARRPEMVRHLDEHVDWVAIRVTGLRWAREARVAEHVPEPSSAPRRIDRG